MSAIASGPVSATVGVGDVDRRDEVLRDEEEEWRRRCVSSSSSVWIVLSVCVVESKESRRTMCKTPAESMPGGTARLCPSSSSITVKEGLRLLWTTSDSGVGGWNGGGARYMFKP